MCDLVRRSLNDIKYSVGNSPLGMWQYHIKEDEFPEVLVRAQRHYGNIYVTVDSQNLYNL